jgi:hypothetical protein
MTETDYLDDLREQGCRLVEATGDGRVTCLRPFIFTCGILRGQMFDSGYDERWCYHDISVAVAALLEWRQRGMLDEPLGWHRATHRGARRPDGDASREYIQW